MAKSLNIRVTHTNTQPLCSVFFDAPPYLLSIFCISGRVDEAPESKAKIPSMEDLGVHFPHMPGGT